MQYDRNNEFLHNYFLLLDKVENIEEYTKQELEDLLYSAENIQIEYDMLQSTVKVNGNSLYGSFGNEYFELYDVDIAEDITTICRHFAILVDRAINNKLKNWGEKELQIMKNFYPNLQSLRKFEEYDPDTINDVCVYGDTDSRYIDLEMIHDLLIDENGNRMKLPEDNKELIDFSIFFNENFLSQIIKNSISEDLDYRNGYKGFLKMGHEITTRNCIFIKSKKYAMSKIWQDGKSFEIPELKYLGMEIKRGETSPQMKKIIKKLLYKYLNEGLTTDDIRNECLKLINYIKSMKKKSIICRYSSVSGVKEIQKNSDGVWDCSKNHVQMQIARNWLNFIEDTDIDNLYKKPFEGQKMAYYKTVDGSKYKVIGIPDDVDVDNVKGLPEPNWNAMILQQFIKPLLKCISDKKEIDDKDCENFLIGVKKIVL
jgi:DNA polymerase elongation subunit (family B)